MPCSAAKGQSHRITAFPAVPGEGEGEGVRAGGRERGAEAEGDTDE